MFEDLRIFVKVVHLTGFSAAARHLKLPTSTVSRAVQRLEAQSGTRLLVRTTRSLRPTPAGLAFYERCLPHVIALEEARQVLTGMDGMAVGLVRLTAPEDIGEHVISPAIGELVRIHPGLTFELVYTSEVLDLVGDGIDLAVRLGKLQTSSLTAKRVGTVKLIVVASPRYLEGRSPPSSPEDLEGHDCITFSSNALKKSWTLHREKDKRATTVPIKARAAANQMSGLVSMALRGGGIAFVPQYLCQQHFRAGNLVRVLPEWSNESLPVSLVSTQGGSKSARNRIVAETLAREIAKQLR